MACSSIYAGFTEHPYGTFAQRMSVPMTLPLPQRADPLQVAGGLNPGLSSWLPLRARAADAPLDTVLVLGATGVAGALAVQNALALGASQVVAVGRNRQALARLESARTTTFALSGDDGTDLAGLRAVLADQRPGMVLDFCWGRPAELIFDVLGRAGADEDQHSCVYVEIGAAAGPGAMLPAALLRSTAIAVRGSGAGSAKLDDIMTELPVYLDKIADGTVRVPVSPYPLDDVANAWTADRPGERVVLTA